MQQVKRKNMVIYQTILIWVYYCVSRLTLLNLWNNMSISPSTSSYDSNIHQLSGPAVSVICYIQMGLRLNHILYIYIYIVQNKLPLMWEWIHKQRNCTIRNNILKKESLKIYMWPIQNKILCEESIENIFESD